MEITYNAEHTIQVAPGCVFDYLVIIYSNKDNLKIVLNRSDMIYEFYSYTGEITPVSYDRIQKEQNITVDFTAFYFQLIKLLNENQTDSIRIALKVTEEGFGIYKSYCLKELNLFSIPMRSSTDEEIIRDLFHRLTVEYSLTQESAISYQSIKEDCEIEMKNKDILTEDYKNDIADLKYKLNLLEAEKNLLEQKCEKYESDIAYYKEYVAMQNGKISDLETKCVHLKEVSSDIKKNCIPAITYIDHYKQKYNKIIQFLDLLSKEVVGKPKYENLKQRLVNSYVVIERMQETMKKLLEQHYVSSKKHKELKQELEHYISKPNIPNMETEDTSDINAEVKAMIEKLENEHKFFAEHIILDTEVQPLKYQIPVIKESDN